MPARTIRTTLIAAVATLGVAVPLIGGAPAAQASPNTGAFWHSSAANHAISCDNMFTLFEGDVNAADSADKAGKKAALKQHLKDATQDLHMAQAAGCDWAT